MKLDIPRITKALELGEYAAELAPAVVHVWVNPPTGKLDTFYALNSALKAATEPGETERLGRELIVWFADLWSQHPDTATHWTPDEVGRLLESDTDPEIYAWLTTRSMVLIGRHRGAHKKK